MNAIPENGDVQDVPSDITVKSICKTWHAVLWCQKLIKKFGVDNPDERDTEADAEGTIRFGIEKANWAHCSGTMMVVGIAKGENNGVGMV